MSPRVFEVHYTLYDPAGTVMDSTRGRRPLSFVEGAGQILAELEAGILPLRVGEKAEIFVPSDHVFGSREEGKVRKLSRDQLPRQDLQIGQQLRVGSDPASPPATVIDVTGAYYIVDTNHPYAGMDLRFEVELMSRREAVPQDLKPPPGNS